MALEIELKFSLEKDLKEKFINFLSQQAEFIRETEQKEVYINRTASSFKFKRENGEIDADDYLRVRFEKSGASVCLKKFNPDPERLGHHTHCDEYEYNVDDGEKALELFEQIGFDDNTWMKKVRKIYNYKNFEIVIDQVESLGVFFEIELKDDTVIDAKVGHRMIKDFLREIQITKIREHRRGYMAMIWNVQDFGEDKVLT